MLNFIVKGMKMKFLMRLLCFYVVCVQTHSIIIVRGISEILISPTPNYGAISPKQTATSADSSLSRKKRQIMELSKEDEDKIKKLKEKSAKDTNPNSVVHVELKVLQMKAKTIEDGNRLCMRRQIPLEREMEKRELEIKQKSKENAKKQETKTKEANNKHAVIGMGIGIAVTASVALIGCVACIVMVVKSNRNYEDDDED